MSWLILAILAALFWAISNIGDKYIISQKIKNPFVYMVMMGFTGLFFVVLLPFVDFAGLNYQIGFLIFLCACLYYWVGGIVYLKALQLEEVSRVNLWWSLIPIFSFIIGFVGGLEKFSINQLVAFVFLLSGSFVASLHSDRTKIYLSKAVGYMIMAGFAFAFYGHILHFITQSVSFLAVFVILNLIFVLFASLWIISSKKLRNDTISTISEHGYLLVLLVVVVVIFETGGSFFNQWALSLGPASLVFSTEGFQSLFVFVIAVLLSIFYPKIIKEKLDRKNIILKITALLLMMSGIVVLYLF